MKLRNDSSFVWYDQSQDSRQKPTTILYVHATKYLLDKRENVKYSQFYAKHFKT